MVGRPGSVRRPGGGMPPRVAAPTSRCSTSAMWCAGPQHARPPAVPAPPDRRQRRRGSRATGARPLPRCVRWPYVHSYSPSDSHCRPGRAPNPGSPRSSGPASWPHRRPRTGRRAWLPRRNRRARTAWPRRHCARSRSRCRRPVPDAPDAPGRPIAPRGRDDSAGRNSEAPGDSRCPRQRDLGAIGRGRAPAAPGRRRPRSRRSKRSSEREDARCSSSMSRGPIGTSMRSRRSLLMGVWWAQLPGKPPRAAWAAVSQRIPALR